jgi:hypothetical protein
MKRKIVEVDLPKNGKVFFAFPTTAMLSIDAYDIVSAHEEGARRNAYIRAAMVANCLVDAKGKLVYPGYKELLEDMEAGSYAEISAEFEKQFTIENPSIKIDPIKNSESIPDSSQPSTSLES